MLTDEWKGCYKRGWSRELVSEAFAHPAKVSFSLAERIYAHMAEEGWIEPGMTVVDPFAGIGGCAYHALKHGLHFIGIELEPKFVDLATQNIALWNRRYAGRFARWGTARVIQGDSRRLADVVHEAGICPKYQTAGDEHGARHSDYGSTPGNLGNLRATNAGFDSAISSPPFGAAHSGNSGLLKTGLDKPNTPQRGNALHPERRAYRQELQGSTDGNLAALRATDAGFSAAVSSPPYAQDETPRLNNLENHANDSPRYYGATPGQLAAMRADGFDSAVSSPPWEDQEPSHAQGTDFGLSHDGGRRFIDSEYGSSDNQLGIESGSDFWHAARAIVEQTYTVLRPGAHAVWVVKHFVRNGALVDFPGQWRQLCEACGFVTLHEHHALLVRDDGTQLAMDGNHKSYRTERKSFFRRLSESKGSPRIDHETIYCVVKEA